MKVFKQDPISKTERRRQDRRKSLDPRFRDPNYPDYVDRRSGQERRCDQDDYSSRINFSEHGVGRRVVVFLGTVCLLVFIYLFCLATVHLCNVSQ